MIDISGAKSAAVRGAQGGPAGLLKDDFEAIGEAAKKNLDDIATPNLIRLRDGLSKTVEQGSLTKAQLEHVRGALVGLNTEITKRGGEPIIEAPAPAVEGKIKGLIARLKDLKDGQVEVGKATKAREAIAKAATESELALIGAQAAEYIKVTEELNDKLKDLRGKDREDAEAKIKQVTDNLLLKWAGFKKDLSDADVRLVPPRVLTDLDAAKSGTERLKLEVKDFNLVLDEHGLKLDETIAKGLLDKEKQRVARERIKAIADEFHFATTQIIGMGDELGLFDEKLRTIATAVGGIAEAVGAFASGDAIGGTLAGLEAVGGLLKGVLGESPAAARARAILQKNSDVIAENTRAVLQNTPGAVFQGAGDFLGGLFGAGGTGLDFASVSGGRPRVTPDMVRSYLAVELAKRGIRFADFESLAKDLGITLDFSTFAQANATLRDFFTRLGQAGVTGFGTSFADQLGRIRTGISIGAIRPEDELNQILGAAGGLKKPPTAILDILNGANLNDPTSRGQVVKKLQDLFTNLPNLSAGALGDLTRDEFVDLISQIIGLLQSDRAFTGFQLPTSTGGPRVDFGTNDGKGGTTGATLPPPIDPAALGELEESNDYLADILATLRSFQPVAPPALPLGSTGTATVGGLTINGGIQLSVNLAPGERVDDPDVVLRLSDRLIEQIDQELAVRWQRFQLSSGRSWRP